MDRSVYQPTHVYLHDIHHISTYSQSFRSMHHLFLSMERILILCFPIIIIFLMDVCLDVCLDVCVRVRVGVRVYTWV